ncbi:colanic acid biosynthesis glycosyl transferase WcaE [Nonlabens ulvanivorans]|nr:glycosyltransferase [Nonlabens ulvanivorans]GAK93153.1 colanic acid biosynthesis glycosyl transferase WcaE [Nonlabens ulvanivorans]
MSILSIITINYNDKVGLERTVNSVQEQTVQDFEYIIIDGGSNDGSKDFLNRSKDYFDYFISEPDTGVYEAMNKGIKQANSEYLLFLNSGDTLYDKNILSKVLPNLKSYQSQIVYGDLYMICEDKTNFINSYPKKLNFNFLKKVLSDIHQLS